jgi:predicted kinase
MLILMAGLPGTGKTHVAEKVAASLDAVILSKDTVRHALFPPELIEYSTGQDDFVIDVLLETAAYIWRKRPKETVILDGRTFSRGSQRQHVIEFAERLGQKWQIVECVCAPDIAKQRLAQPEPIHPAGNRTPQLYDEVKARWEPIAQDHLSVRTDAPIDFANLVRELTT